MSNKTFKIIAIDPGTKYTGVAVMQENSLIYCGAKVIKDRRSPSATLTECKATVVELMLHFKPDVLVIEKTFFAKSRNSALLSLLVLEIRRMAQRNGIQVVTVAPSTVKKLVCGNGRATKQEVARAVVGKYPELKVFLTQDRKWKERFYQHMFDAAALGLIYGSQPENEYQHGKERERT